MDFSFDCRVCGSYVELTGVTAAQAELMVTVTAREHAHNADQRNDYYRSEQWQDTGGDCE